MENAEKTSNPSSTSCFPIQSQDNSFMSPSNNVTCAQQVGMDATSIPLFEHT